MNTTTVSPLPARTAHKFFSIGRVSAITGNTLLELVRLKVFYFLLLFALLIIGGAGFTSLFDFQIQEQLQILKDVSLGSMSIFTLLLSILATAMMLPKDIEDRTLYTILAKPVPRFEYMMGKLFGIFSLLLISILIMSAMFVAALYAKQQMLIGTTLRQSAGFPPEQVQAMVNDVKSQTFTVSLIPCVIAIYLKATLFSAFTMLISTFATSTIFTIFIAFTAYFIGSVEGVAREYLYSPGGGSDTAKNLMGLVALFFPDLQLFNLVDDIVAGNSIALDLFMRTAGLGVVYTFVYSFVAYVVFAFKEL
ncbi:MAG: ABC transporter permease subunit [Chthoniobacteraceae bacterium]